MSEPTPPGEPATKVGGVRKAAPTAKKPAGGDVQQTPQTSVVAGLEAMPQVVAAAVGGDAAVSSDAPAPIELANPEAAKKQSYVDQKPAVAKPATKGLPPGQARQQQPR
mmetsp:Transcript_13871/g.34172  ORF Transcript_13871/g.34172 Transcript_13871/m.34172 type:complete len:109 (-) Transcript_13871:277-603(-)